MDLGKNKKWIIIGGVVLLAGALYYRFKHKNTQLNSADLNTNVIVDTNASTTQSLYPTGINEKDTITLGTIDPTGAVYVVLSGKKYPFVSEKAFLAYGWTQPKVITQSQLDLIPKGGFVGEDGKVVNQ